MQEFLTQAAVLYLLLAIMLPYVSIRGYRAGAPLPENTPCGQGPLAAGGGRGIQPRQEQQGMNDRRGGDTGRAGRHERLDGKDQHAQEQGADAN